MSARIDWVITENAVYDSTLTQVSNITEKVTGFSWTIAAQGGYATAMITIACDEPTAYRMLNEHVGRRITAINPLGVDPSWIVWEGQVFSVTVNDGNTSTTRTMENVFNRTTVIYSAVNAGREQIVAQQTTTADADDATSQALYGVRHMRYMIGASTTTEAAALRDLLLAQSKNPRASNASARVGAGDVGHLSVTIGCVGYYETLRQRFYSTTTTGSATLDAIIKAVLTSVGQHINSDQSNIAANTYSRSQYQDGTLPAATYIDNLCALGDGATTRRSYFGIYENRKPYYTVESSSADYYLRKWDSGYKIYEVSSGREIMPWLIQPGKICQMSDLFPDQTNVATALDDVRTFVIGEVTFNAPYSAIITPLTMHSSDIMLARMGFSQIGRQTDLISAYQVLSDGKTNSPDAIGGTKPTAPFTGDMSQQYYSYSNGTWSPPSASAPSAAAPAPAMGATGTPSTRALTNTEWNTMAAVIRDIAARSQRKPSSNILDWVKRTQTFTFAAGETINTITANLYREYGLT